LTISEATAQSQAVLKNSKEAVARVKQKRGITMYNIENFRQTISVCKISKELINFCLVFADDTDKQIAELQEKLDNSLLHQAELSRVGLEYNDKLHRRNLQIAELKKQRCPWNIVKDCKKSV